MQYAVTGDILWICSTSIEVCLNHFIATISVPTYSNAQMIWIDDAPVAKGVDPSDARMMDPTFYVCVRHALL